MSLLHDAAAEINRDPNAGAVFLKLLGPAGWKWFSAHQRERVLKVKVAIFSVTILVKDLRPLFVLAFGNPPVGSGI